MTDRTGKEPFEGLFTTQRSVVSHSGPFLLDVCNWKLQPHCKFVISTHPFSTVFPVTEVVSEVQRHLEVE